MKSHESTGEDIRCCCVVDSIVVAVILVLWFPALISSDDGLISISHIVLNIRYCSQDKFFADFFQSDNFL